MAFKNKLSNTTLSLAAVLLTFHAAHSQYAPPVGQAGTTAMHKDSSAFVAWATGCESVRGLQDISTPALGYASVGDNTMATGKAQSNAVLSLGDGGTATCTFLNPIMDGPGFDFAVFENGFDDIFLELAFVEVSSDGVNFVRFKSHSLTPTNVQTGSFGSTDATKINNLAGKYRGGYGTPFDLQELANSSIVNIGAVTHVRIVDVVGSIHTDYATMDSFNNKINDPWPTAFPSGGFDLDAVGVVHQKTTVGITERVIENQLSIYPNPVSVGSVIHVLVPGTITSVQLWDVQGKLLRTGITGEMEIQGIEPGFYVIKVVSGNHTYTKKISVL